MYTKRRKPSHYIFVVVGSGKPLEWKKIVKTAHALLGVNHLLIIPFASENLPDFTTTENYYLFKKMSSLRPYKCKKLN